MNVISMEDVKFRAWDGERKRMDYDPMFRCMWNDGSGGIPVATFKINQAKFEPIALMQFVGLKDRKDKDVYEEDIVRAKSNRTKKIITGVVKWQTWEAAFRLVVKGDYCYRIDDIHNAQVIGNIYENPELLGVAKEAR
jgi:uncharacterized phage protein (TIGR01671 family)